MWLPANYFIVQHLSFLTRKMRMLPVYTSWSFLEDSMRFLHLVPKVNGSRCHCWYSHRQYPVSSPKLTVCPLTAGPITVVPGIHSSVRRGLGTQHSFNELNWWSPGPNCPDPSEVPQLKEFEEVLHHVTSLESKCPVTSQFPPRAKNNLTPRLVIFADWISLMKELSPQKERDFVWVDYLSI